MSLWFRKSAPGCPRGGFSSLEGQFLIEKDNFWSKKTNFDRKKPIFIQKDKFLRQKDNVSNPGFGYLFDISRIPGVHGLLEDWSLSKAQRCWRTTSWSRKTLSPTWSMPSLVSPTKSPGGRWWRSSSTWSMNATRATIEWFQSPNNPWIPGFLEISKNI